MAEPKFVTIREGDTIVIRLPFALIEESLADAMPPTANPVTVHNVDDFLDGLVDMINSSNVVEELLSCEVGAMVEDRDRSVEEHVIRSLRAA